MIVCHKVLEKLQGLKPLPLIGLGISDILFQRDLVRAFPPLKHRNTEDQFVGLVDTAEIKLVLKRPTCLSPPQCPAKVLLAPFLAAE